MNNINRNNYSDIEIWKFIEEYLPNYYTRDDVLYNNILLKFIEGEELHDKDLEWIREDFGNDRRLIIENIVTQETQFFREALESYYRKT